MSVPTNRRLTFPRTLLLIASIGLLPASVARAQPLTEWEDDFTVAATYDYLSLVGPCYGGPPTKYTVIEVMLADIFNEWAVSGGGDLLVSTSSIAEILPGFGRIEMAIVGWMGVGLACPGEPPFLRSTVEFDDTQLCIYAGFEFTKAQDLNGEYTWAAAMKIDLATTSWMYVNIDPADPDVDRFSLREYVLAVDQSVEAADDDIVTDGYDLNTEYNYSFCADGTNFSAELWKGSDRANPLEILGPVANANHTAPEAVLVAFMNKARSGFLINQATHQGNHTFWVIEGDPLTHYPSPQADLDDDRDVDGFDFLTFNSCFNGSGRPAQPGCLNADSDLDEDNDVDGFDFLTFNNCFNGSARRPLPACMPPNPLIP